MLGKTIRDGAPLFDYKKVNLPVTGFGRAWAAVAKLVAMTAILAPLSLQAANSSYTGTFATDDGKKVIYVTLPAAGAVTIQTLSYAGGTNQAGTTIPAGGFDPTLTIYDAQGRYIVDNRDAGCGAGNSAADPTTSFCWDAKLSLTLPAGTYYVILTQGDNQANGGTIADGFVYDGATTFTTPAGVSSQGFWDLFPSKRTANFAVDVLGGNSVVTGISNSTPPFGVTSSAYSGYTFTANSGPGATLTWSVSSGTLPPGMTLDPATGTLSGTPTAPGGYTFVVQVTDGIQPVRTSVSLTIYGKLGVTSTSLPDGTAGKSYGPASVGALGGGGNYSWSASNLPANLTMDANGVISGVPTAAGTFQIGVTVQDGVTGQAATGLVQLTIKAGPLSLPGPLSLGNFVPGAKISGNASALGGVAPLLYSAPALPAGLSLNTATGAIGGVAGAAGLYSFTVQVSDSQTPPATASTTVGYSILGFTTFTLPAGTSGSAYTTSLPAVGGSSPYKFEGTGLPSGFTLSPAGVLSSAQPTTGTFTFTARVTDTTGLTTTALLSFTINGPANGPLAIPSSSLVSGIVGSSYTGTLQATGGGGSYKYDLVAGNLPSGLSLTDSGVLQGTPKAAGDYSFSVRVTDSNGNKAIAVVTVSIAPLPLTLSLGSFPDGVILTDYPAQILSAAGGVEPYTFTLSAGNLPDGLTLSGNQITGVPKVSGTFSFSVKVTDNAGKAATAGGSIFIKPSTADLILSQKTVTFTVTSGANGLPTPANVTVRSSVIQQILGFNYSVAPAAPWMDTVGGGSTPGSITMSLNSSAPSLPVGTYSTVITVGCSTAGACAGAPQSINVTLNVTAPPAQLTVTPTVLQFSASAANPGSSSQLLGVQNSGSGVININSVTAADSWITVTGAPKTLGAGPGQNMTVTVNSTGLDPGFYKSSVTVNGDAGSASATVTLLVTPAVTISLGPNGTQYTVPQGNPPGDSNGSFAVTVTGAGTANWTSALQAGSNASWLKVTTSGGSATAATAGTVSYALDSAAVAALQPGTYYGNIQVTSADAVNSPQVFQVVLSVTATTTSITPTLSAKGIVFSASPSDTGASALVTVYASSATPIPYQASAFANDGGSWLSVAPTTGTSSAGAPGSSRISVKFTGLAPGTYRGGVSFSFSSDAVRTVNVTVNIPQAGGAVTSDSAFGAAAVACTPRSVIATQTGLYNNFAQQVGWPVPVAVQLIDNCGQPVSGAQVTATFSNGDPQVILTALNNSSGIYNGTWTPQRVSAQTTLTATVSGISLPSSPAVVTGEVRTNVVPIITKNGTVDAFNPIAGAALAPGEIIAIYGSNLASQTVVGTTVPLANSLAGTSVQIGNFAAPVYFVSPGQINAQVPYEVKPGTTYPVQVTSNGNTSTVASISIVPTAPGLAAFQSGQIIAQHAADFSLVTAGSPARAGEFLVLYLSGLGQVDNPVATGAAASANPLSRPVVAPVLRLNGSVIPVAFGGLSPSAIGLGQINFQIPAGTTPGDLTLTVSQGQGGTASVTNTTIIPVR